MIRQGRGTGGELRSACAPSRNAGGSWVAVPLSILPNYRPTPILPHRHGPHRRASAQRRPTSKSSTGKATELIEPVARVLHRFIPQSSNEICIFVDRGPDNNPISGSIGTPVEPMVRLHKPSRRSAKPHLVSAGGDSMGFKRFPQSSLKTGPQNPLGAPGLLPRRYLYRIQDQ